MTVFCRNEVTIPVELELAWEMLARFDKWPTWNPFVVRVTGASTPVLGPQVVLHLCWPDGERSQVREEIVDVVDVGSRRRFSWSYRGPWHRIGLLQASRTITLEALSAGACRYSSEERFEGPARKLVPISNVREASERMAAAFAGACVAKAQGDALGPDTQAPAAAAGCPAHHATATSTRPPPLVSGALPIVGHMPEFRGAHLELFERGYREHGPLFAIALGPWKCAVVAGPELGGVFYGRTDHELHTQKVYGYLSKMFGRVALTQSPAGYAAERHILTSPFKAHLMDDNLGIIDQEVRAYIDGLGPRGELELVASTSAVMQQISAHVLMGRDFRDRMDAEFWSLYRDLAEGLDQALPPWLPIPRFIRRDIAKARLHRKLGALIDERRARVHARPNESEPEDMLQVLVEARLEGELLPVERVIDYILALVFAGFETTTSHAAWGLIHLLQHGSIQAELRAEVDAALAGVASVDRQTLAALEPVRRALRETERLMPVADRHVRSVEEDLEIGGYVVPKGWIMMSAVALTHRMPELYERPEVYDPSRFTRGEGQTKYGLVGFGAGRHRCTGVNLAYVEMTILLARLLEAFELELVAPLNPQIANTLGVLVPEPTTIRYRRRT